MSVADRPLAFSHRRAVLCARLGKDMAGGSALAGRLQQQAAKLVPPESFASWLDRADGRYVLAEPRGCRHVEVKSLFSAVFLFYSLLHQLAGGSRDLGKLASAVLHCDEDVEQALLDVSRSMGDMKRSVDVD